MSENWRKILFKYAFVSLPVSNSRDRDTHDNLKRKGCKNFVLVQKYLYFQIKEMSRYILNPLVSELPVEKNKKQNRIVI